MGQGRLKAAADISRGTMQRPCMKSASYNWIMASIYHTSSGAGSSRNSPYKGDTPTDEYTDQADGVTHPSAGADGPVPLGSSGREHQSLLENRIKKIWQKCACQIPYDSPVGRPRGPQPAPPPGIPPGGLFLRSMRGLAERGPTAPAQRDAAQGR